MIGLTLNYFDLAIPELKADDFTVLQVVADNVLGLLWWRLVWLHGSSVRADLARHRVVVLTKAGARNGRMN